MSDEGADVRIGDARLTVSLFGPLDLRINGKSLPALRARKSEWLLALLVLRAGRAVSREGLAATLWPESEQDKGLYNLRRTLYDLRQALGPTAERLSSFDARSIRLDLVGADVDVIAFDSALRRGDSASLREAVALYRGPLLEGCAETWAVEARAMRDEGFLSALEQLAASAMKPPQPDALAAAELLRRALAHAPTRETALHALLEALAASGDRASLILEYRRFRLRLYDEMCATPSPETIALYERLKAVGPANDVHAHFAIAPVRPTPSEMESRWPATADEDVGVEPAGGAVPLNSPYYVVRPTNVLFYQAITRGDSVVLVKGPRQVGKTSLLARGLARARAAGCRTVHIDIQKFGAAQLETSETFLMALARQIADQLNLDVSVDDLWNARAGANDNFERFLRRKVLATTEQPFVWALDEVDQLFPHRWASEVFGLFRSWHNERALEPDGPWGRLTLAMAYATEAHLFITDLNQSPFNVGTRLTLDDFSDAEVAVLDEKLGSPLGGVAALARLISLLGGHPYLIRRGLQELLTGMSLDELEECAPRDDGPFGGHLRRLLYALSQDVHLCGLVRDVLRGGPPPDRLGFFRLHSAGVVAGNVPEEARPRCGLYAQYLARNLP